MSYTKHLTLLILLFVSTALAASQRKPTIVAVIDTGIHSSIKSGLCKMGHKDLTGNGLHDTHGHGTNVSGLIHRFAKRKNYCQVIIKFFEEDGPDHENAQRSIKALQHAINISVDYINYSAGGPDQIPAERRLIKQALDQGIVIVAAAGNDGIDLDLDCYYYPACYDKRIVVVGNRRRNGKKAFSSNYGSVVDVWELGISQTAYGITMTGASQATAVTTGKLIGKYRKLK